MTDQLSVQWTGVEEVIRRLENGDEAVKAGVGDANEAIGAGVLATAKASIQRGPKSGKIYSKYNPRRQHRASAPGQAPATDTGTLVRSGYYDNDRRALRVRIGFVAKYAFWLEFGTRFMLARPFLRMAMRKWRKRSLDIYKRMIQARMR